MESNAKTAAITEVAKPNIDKVRYDALQIKGLLQLYDEAMDNEMNLIGELAPDSISVKLAKERYDSVLSMALGAVITTVDHLLLELGET